jgi:hypothetical protein
VRKLDGADVIFLPVTSPDNRCRRTCRDSDETVCRQPFKSVPLLTTDATDPHQFFSR